MLRFVALWLLVRVIGRWPARLLYVFADIGGTIVWIGWPRLQRVTRDHMRHVLGGRAGERDVTRAARACLRSAARYYADFARAPHEPPGEALLAVDEYEGIEHFFEAYDRGCGMIVCSAHLGNPEFLVRAVAGLGIELLVFTEPLSPPRVHDFVHELRQAPNARFIPGGRAAAREALTHLRRRGVLALLCDRDVLGSGRPVPFFEERARLPSGAVELALRTGAPMLPAFVLRSGPGRYRVVIDRAIALRRTGNHEADVDAGMLAMARALEAGIRRAPDQWFPLDPVWRGLAL